MAQPAPGEVEIQLPYRADLCQQQGFLHAGIVTAIVDSACGYAAFALMTADAQVMTVELKVNSLAPAAGERFVARDRQEKSICRMQATMTAGGAQRAADSV